MPTSGLDVLSAIRLTGDDAISLNGRIGQQNTAVDTRRFRAITKGEKQIGTAPTPVRAVPSLVSTTAHRCAFYR